MSECCFHTNIINEMNPHETPNGQRIPVSRHGGISHVFWGRLAGESKGGHSSADTCAGRANGTWRRDHACQDCQRSCGCTGGIARHALKKSVVSWSASISGGLFRGFRFCQFFMVDRNRSMERIQESDQCLPVRPAQIDIFSLRRSAYPCLGLADAICNFCLRQSERLNIRNDFFPVHAAIITTVFL